jgi:hypothetical protein
VSFFGWVDYADDDRRRMAEVIELFSERGTRDELGIAVIRDAVADLLFPGTGALQTRARYFLFAPWIYQRLERSGVSAADVGAKARDEELKLVPVLEQTGDSGVIGTRSKERLQRLPSSIYWSGLGVWGLRRMDLTQEQYHRSFGRLRSGRSAVDDDRNPIDGAGGFWHPKLPPAPSGFPKEASLQLSRAEAEFLSQQITTLRPRSLLAYLVSNELSAEAPFIWAHPSLERFPETNRREVDHARCFSELMHGPALLYNLMLAERRDHEEWRSHYQSALGEWANAFEARQPAFVSWARPSFWQLPMSPSPVLDRARRFVEAWAAIALSRSPHRLQDDPDARRLIQDRERSIKHGLARLENKRALERWQGASGARQLTFRWGTVQTIVNDIVSAEEGRA